MGAGQSKQQKTADVDNMDDFKKMKIANVIYYVASK